MAEATAESFGIVVRRDVNVRVVGKRLLVVRSKNVLYFFNGLLLLDVGVSQPLQDFCLQDLKLLGFPFLL